MTPAPTEFGAVRLIHMDDGTAWPGWALCLPQPGRPWAPSSQPPRPAWNSLDMKWPGHHVGGPQPKGHRRDRKWPGHQVGGPQPEGHRRDRKWPGHHVGVPSLRDTGETGSGLVTRLGAPSLQGHRRDRKWPGHQVKDPLPGVTHERQEVAWSPCQRPPVCRDTGEHTVVGSQHLSSLWKETGPQR